MDGFDSDVLIYAAIDGHPLGDRVRQLILAAGHGSCIGSALLIPELLIKPTRLTRAVELTDLKELLATMTLYDADYQTASTAVDLGARYGLKTVDAVHLATAVHAGADRFITNNRRDFTKEITEIDVAHPDELH